MFQTVYVMKSQSEISDKTTEKQNLGFGAVLIVSLVILFILALLLPVGFYHLHTYPGIYTHYFGSWRKSDNVISQSTALDGEDLIEVQAPNKGIIRLEAEPVREFENDTADASALTLSDKTKTCSKSDNNCHSRHKRAAKKKGKKKKGEEKTLTEEEYYREAYKAYLKCLTERTESYFENLASKPNVVLSEEEATIVLKCNMCLRPDHDASRYNYRWERFLMHSPNQTWEGVTEEEDHFEVDEVTGDLTLMNMLEEDSGRYVCYAYKQAFQAVHYVDILATERTRQVFDATVTPAKQVKQLEQMAMEDTTTNTTTTAKQHPLKLTKAVEPESVPDLNLYVFTQWSEWTKCTRCGTRGERSRHGLCTVKMADQEKDTEFEMLKRFPDGLPCRSSLVPPKLAEVKQVKERYSENELGYCEVECPKEPKKILDEDGNPVKVFRNPLKMIKRPKWLPKLPKLVVRRVYYVVTGKKTAIACPGTRKGQAIRWSNGSQVYDRIELAQDPHHRVNIDTSSRLIIHNLQLTDTSLYTCYVYGKLQGSIKLKVVEPYKEEGASDWITTAGMLGTVLLILYMVYMLCQQERKYGKAMR